jgi:hypothetical protein
LLCLGSSTRMMVAVFVLSHLRMRLHTKERRLTHLQCRCSGIPGWRVSGPPRCPVVTQATPGLAAGLLGALLTVGKSIRPAGHDSNKTGYKISTKTAAKRPAADTGTVDTALPEFKMTAAIASKQGGGAKVGAGKRAAREMAATGAGGDGGHTPQGKPSGAAGVVPHNRAHAEQAASRGSGAKKKHKGGEAGVSGTQVAVRKQSVAAPTRKDQGRVTIAAATPKAKKPVRRGGDGKA